MQKNIIALYIRLSLEDTKYDSMSISNQQLILREKAMSLNEWPDSEVMEFIDNGHTGTNFERPAVQELLQMVQEGKIGCIIVKDLSRFGRNSIETGYFIERVFPLYHVRFISVSDDYDSDNYKGTTGGIEVAFKYLINEAYSRDMSMKTRSAKYAKMRRGEYQSDICPYGYQKGADGKMEPNPETAPIVCQIFHWADEGNSSAEIARKLYELHIPTPGEYRAAARNMKYPVDRVHGVWNISTVLRILSDERYTGTYVIGKYTVKEIGGSRVRRKDESEWFKIPDHHQPIVNADLFSRTNAKGRRYKLPNKQQRDYPLKGKVFCGSCAHALSRNGTGNCLSYYCRHSIHLPDFPCHGLHIRASELEQSVLEIIKAHAQVYLGLDTETEHLSIASSQQAEHEKQLKFIQERKRQLYERYVREEISFEVFQSEKEKCDAEASSIKATLSTLASQLKRSQEEYELQLKRKDIAQAAASAERLTIELCNLLIHRIFVYPDNRIEIEYAFQDLYPHNEG